MQSFKLIHDDINSSTALLWYESLRDYSDSEIAAAAMAAKEFTGFFTIGEFISMIPKKEQAKACHKILPPAEKIPIDYEKSKQRMAKLRESLKS